MTKINSKAKLVRNNKLKFITSEKFLQIYHYKHCSQLVMCAISLKNQTVLSDEIRIVYKGLCARKLLLV